jgi:hypothetical protein
MIYGSTEFNTLLVEVIRREYRHPHYKEAVRLAEEMSVHVYGNRPDSLLKRVRPGEDEEIMRYRLENFEATTKAPCGKALKIVSKMFNPNLSSIIFPKDNKTAEALKEYTMYYYPVYNSLTVFNKDVTLKKMTADANALMAVKPQRIPRNDAEKVKPIVTIYDSKDVWYWDLDHFLVNTEIKRIDSRIVYTFEYYDIERYAKFQAEAPKDNEPAIINLIEEYPHNFTDQHGEKEIPAWKLRGNSLSLNNGDVLYESFFADAKAHWNLSIIHESDVLGAFVKHMNPQRVVIGEECSNSKVVDGITLKCRGGWLQGGDATGKGFRTKCDKCDGTGRVASSPYEDHIINRQKLDEMTNMSMDAVGYVKVPVEATKLLADRAKEMVHEGNAAINMLIEDYVGANQSGIAKLYDRSAQSDTIYDIGCIMYDVHFQNQFYFINKYMNGVSDSASGKVTDQNLPQINKPTKFNIETTGELVLAFKDAAASGVDRYFLQAKQIEIISRDMDTNPDLKKYYIMLINLDPLFGLTQDVIDLNMMRGLVYKTDAVIHSNLKPFIDRALAENREFMNLDKEAKMAILKAYAEELITAEKPQIDMSQIPDQNV